MIPISLILDKVKPLVGDGYVYKLISSFLTLPISYGDGGGCFLWELGDVFFLSLYD